MPVIKVFAPFVGSGLESWLGGGPIRFFELIKAMILSGDFSFTLATTSGGRKMISDYFSREPEVLQQIRFKNIRASLFLKREPFPLYRIWSYFLSWLHLMFFLGRENYDVGICPSDFFFNLHPLRRMRRKGRVNRLYSSIYHRIPHPSERAGAGLSNRLSWIQQKKMFQLLTKYFDGLTISDTQEGHEIGKHFQADLGYQGIIHYVKMGVRLKEIEDTPPSDKKFDAIHIGLRPNKGVYDLPRIWKGFKAKHPKSTLGIMGGGSPQLRDDILAAFSREGVADSVHFLGFVEEQEKFALIKSARLFIAPSHEEGWGIAVGEALGCGTPVVAYKLKAYTSAYQQEISYVDCFDQEQFAEEMDKILTDKTKYQKLSRQGLQFMKDYDWGCLFGKELDILRGRKE